MCSHTFACINSSPCIRRLKFLNSCAVIAEQKAWWPVHNPLKWQQPISLLPLPLPPAALTVSLFPHHPCPTPLREGGCDWLMHADVDSDININHVPPSGHWLTRTPQEESSFIIFALRRFLFSGWCVYVHRCARPVPVFQLSKNLVTVNKSPELWWKTALHNVSCIVNLFFLVKRCEVFYVFGKEQSFRVCVFLFLLAPEHWITNVFPLSSFLASSFPSGLSSLHLSPCPPSLHALSLTSTLCLGFLHLPLRCRGGSERVGGGGGGSGPAVGRWGRCLGIERRGGRGRLSALEPLTRAWFMAQGAPIGTGLEVLCLTALQREEKDI